MNNTVGLIAAIWIVILLAAAVSFCISAPGSPDRKAAKWVLILSGIIFLAPFFILADLVKRQK